MEQWKRKIVRGIAVDSLTPLTEVGLENHEIERVWTILDEERMFEPDKFNPYTGEKIENLVPKTLETARLVHKETVFLEDKVHDWNVYGDKFKYYTRIGKPGKKFDLLIEYRER